MHCFSIRGITINFLAGFSSNLACYVPILNPKKSWNKVAVNEKCRMRAKMQKKMKLRPFRVILVQLECFPGYENRQVTTATLITTSHTF